MGGWRPRAPDQDLVSAANEVEAVRDGDHRGLLEVRLDHLPRDRGRASFSLALRALASQPVAPVYMPLSSSSTPRGARWPTLCRGPPSPRPAPEPAGI